jgi:hypothetical protein
LTVPKKGDKLTNLHLVFADGVQIEVDKDSIEISRANSGVKLSRAQALMVQRFLQDACSTVWRDSYVVEPMMDVAERAVQQPTLGRIGRDETEPREPTS